MWVYVRFMTCAVNEKVKVDNLSHTDLVDALRPRLSLALGGESKCPVHRMRIFHKGKQLEDGHTLFQYDVKNDEILQVLLRVDPDSPTPSAPPSETTPAPIESLQVPLPAPSEDQQESLCDKCLKNPKRRCTECGCNICGGKHDDDKTVVCDECQYYFHWDCLSPPLLQLPDEEWFCKDCTLDTSTIVKPGETIDISKSKKSKMPSATQKREWGRGMACVGRSKECTIVDKDHFGPIPGIEVGQTWRFRMGVSEAGIHRPPVGGIAGSVNAGGAQSIVLAAGYPEDIDSGDSFIYTGSGGRDLKTGNKRTAEQTLDQTLTKQNLALAMTCDAPPDPKNGAQAKNWKKSKPVRVVRTEKLKKHHPKYAPDKGCRYDGIYRLKRYWPEKGSTGFIVWRYEFIRDDDAPPPWTQEGKKRIADLGLEMIVPENYTDKETKEKKRSSDDQTNPVVKKPRKQWKPSDCLQKLINADKINSRTWQAILSDKVLHSMGDFIEALQSHFTCPVCYDFVKNPPVTTSCGHTVCMSCLEVSVEGFGPKCPSCRTSLLTRSNAGEVDFEEAKKVQWRKEVKPNGHLVAALKAIIPSF